MQTRAWANSKATLQQWISQYREGIPGTKSNSNHKITSFKELICIIFSYCPTLISKVTENRMRGQEIKVWWSWEKWDLGTHCVQRTKATQNTSEKLRNEQDMSRHSQSCYRILDSQPEPPCHVLPCSAKSRHPCIKAFLSAVKTWLLNWKAGLWQVWGAWPPRAAAQQPLGPAS